MTTKRKGAQRRADVPPKILRALNRGELETASLAEWLIVDQRALLAHVLPTVGLGKRVAYVDSAATSISQPTAMKLVVTIGQALAPVATKAALTKLSRHPSDIVRSWAAYAVAGEPTAPLDRVLAALRPFAADAHFGVREIAWMAARPAIAADLDAAIARLATWTTDDDANVRRFASEVSRPRGVWCKHIELLKQEPERGLPILLPLRNDVAKYVRDSVANWLNDAAKTKPQWVRAVCRQWGKESPTKETAYIIRRGTRSLSS